jgi:hypothetical protein
VRVCSKRESESTLYYCSTAPITRLFAWGGRGGTRTEEGDSGGHVPVLGVVYYCSTLLLFITAVPTTKLCAWGEEDSGGHVL